MRWIRCYAKKLGVDVDNLLVSQPDSGEQALEITEALVRSGAIDVLVVDSVAALVPKAELDGEMGDSHMGLQARLMSQALRKLTGTVSKSRTSLIFINQIREKIGVMFGNPETTTGGRALKFYSSVRVDIRRIAAIKEGDVVTGNRTKVKIVKNKVAAPFREAEFDILYGEGISREGDVLDLAVANNIVEKSGAWYSYSGERIGQGRENTRNFLKENKDIFAKMDGEVRKKLDMAASPRLRCPRFRLPARQKPKKRSAGAEDSARANHRSGCLRAAVLLVIFLELCLSGSLPLSFTMEALALTARIPMSCLNECKGPLSRHLRPADERSHRPDSARIKAL